MTSNNDVLVLPKGGVLLPASTGWIQYGAVPETIKDTMLLPEGVPSTFVIPPQLFSPERGISLAELEFPCYYNFFIRGGKTQLVCRSSQRGPLETILSEAVFGPAEFDSAEFAVAGAPDLRSEMTHFARNPKSPDRQMVLSDLVEFIEFESDGVANLGGGLRVTAEDHGGISLVENGKAVSAWKGDPPLPAIKPWPKGTPKAFWAPLLGVSVIGNGHGFDPGNRTSGFIIWVNGQGVLVDPPVDSVEWLKDYDISPKDVNTLILTHCHADHDAGTLQTILQEGRVTVYTTPTVLQSFVTKYSGLVGMTDEAFQELFDFVPVTTDNPTYLHGAEATFRYSLHSIPCAGFDLKLGGKSLIYPSDTLNDPKTIRDLHDKGVLNQDRRDTLIDFPWEHNLVLHEAGIPPIHTPIDYLATLEEEIKRKTLLVHVSEKSVPAGSGLRVAPTGLENTIDLGAAHLPIQSALSLLDAMARVEIMSELPVSRASEFLRMVRKEIFVAGDKIIAEGDVGKAFYIILSGHAAVWKKGKEFKIYSAYDYFGEAALVLDELRSASVFAKTALEALVLTRRDFLHLLRDTDLPDRLTQLTQARANPSWELLVISPIFRGLSSNQNTQLQQLMERMEISTGSEIGDAPLLIEDGLVDVLVGDHLVGRLGKGNLAADPEQLHDRQPSRYLFKASSDVRGYLLDRDGFRHFLEENPGAYLQLKETTTAWAHRAQAAELRARKGSQESPGSA